MNLDYLHLLSDHDHLFNLAKTYSKALRKQEEVDTLTSKLSNNKDTLEATLMASHEAENQIVELNRKLRCQALLYLTSEM